MICFSEILNESSSKDVSSESEVEKSDDEDEESERRPTSYVHPRGKDKAGKSSHI